MVYTLFHLLLASIGYSQPSAQVTISENTSELKSSISGNRYMGKIINASRFQDNLRYSRFDEKTLELEQELIYEVEMAVYEGQQFIGGNYIFLNSEYDQANDSELLLATVIDARSGELLKKQVAILGTKGRIPAHHFQRTKFHLEVSADSSKLLVHYKRFPVIKDASKNRDIVGLYVFDKELNLISGGEYKLPKKESEMTPDQYAVSNVGHVYITTLVKARKRDSKGKWKTINAVQVLIMDFESEEFNIADMKTKGAYVSEVDLIEFDKHLYLYGYYRKENNGLIEGFYISNISNPESMESIYLYEIPDGLFGKFESGGLQAKYSKLQKKQLPIGLNTVHKPKLKFFANGEMLFSIEETDLKYSATNYLDAYLVKVGSDWSMDWAQKIPKYQRGSSISYFSFRHVLDNDKHIILFTDHPENDNLQEDRPPINYAGGPNAIVKAYIIDDNSGAINPLTILNCSDLNGDRTYSTDVDRFQHMGNGRFVYSAYRKEKNSLIVDFTLEY